MAAPSSNVEPAAAKSTFLQTYTADFVDTLRDIARWTLLGGLVGILAGIASAVFLISLSWATNTRVANPLLLFLLPISGAVIGWIYRRYGGSASQGTNLVIEEIHSNTGVIPLRMAPLVLLGTIATHLFGGSAGREGTAIQMGASLADSVRRVPWLHTRLSSQDRRLLIMAGISGGFSSVFGTPAAGFIFGMEVQNVGRIRYEGIIPCLAASVTGDFVTRAIGATHSIYPPMPILEVDPLLIGKVALSGLGFGLASLLFIELTHWIKARLAKTNTPLLRPVTGGLIIIALTLLFNTQDYLGLSLPLIQRSVSGEGVMPFAFLLKIIFTAVTLGSGYLGGEVTPLFVIGSTLGFTLGTLLGVDPGVLASIGFVAVFAGASNTPLACAVMGVELFGSGSTVYLFLGCVIAYLTSGHRGIYSTQRIDTPKYRTFIFDPMSPLAHPSASKQKRQEDNSRRSE
jgi:H+/Cl- antiporter ClcA